MNYTELAQEANRLKEYKNYIGEDRVVPVKEVIAKQKSKESGRLKVGSGFGSLDKLIDGFRSGELITITGQTGTGKTVVLQTFVDELDKKGVNTLFFSFEVGYSDLEERWGDNMPEFYAPMETSSANLKWLEEKILEGIAKYNTRAIFVDHLHYLLGMDDVGRGNSSLMIGAIMRELKQMAIRNNVIMFVVAHVKKIDTNQTPRLSDIRDSSFVGQESDIVMIIDREFDDEANVYTTEATLYVVKNRRRGTQGSVGLVFRKGRYYEIQSS